MPIGYETSTRKFLEAEEDGWRVIRRGWGGNLKKPQVRIGVLCALEERDSGLGRVEEQTGRVSENTPALRPD